jgi:hypothetical protein
MGHPSIFGCVEEDKQRQVQRRWGEGLRSPPVARSGGLRMGYPGFVVG